MAFLPSAQTPNGIPTRIRLRLHLLASTALGLGLALALGSCRRSPTRYIHDGFEDKTLSPVWSTDRFEPGAVKLQSAVVKTGHGAVKITVHEGDKREKTGDTETERAELRERKDLGENEGDSYAYRFSVFLPEDTPIVPTRLVLAQWKQDDPAHTANVDSPVVALRYVGGELSITLQTSKERMTVYRTTEDVRGRWLDFVFHLKLTRAPEGRVRAWLNGKKIVNVQGVTAYTEEYGYPKEVHFYFKMGLYRDRMAEPMTVYFDDYDKRPMTPAEKY